MEIWDVYDRDRVKTGETAERGPPHGQGQYHIVVSICIIGSDGKMLIQQRQPWKEGYPDLWDITVGGSALAGETSGKAAEREVLEEIGYPLSLTNVRPSFTVNFYEGFDDFYIVKADIDLCTLRLQQEEVKAVKWASKDEILSMMDQGSFIPYHKQIIELIFAMKDHLGAHAN